MDAKRTHIVIPSQLVAQIDALVGRRGRSAFLTGAAAAELERLRQTRSLEATAGAWKDRDHPELKGGSARWVKRLRSDSDRRPTRNRSG